MQHRVDAQITVKSKKASWAFTSTTDISVTAFMKTAAFQIRARVRHAMTLLAGLETFL